MHNLGNFSLKNKLFIILAFFMALYSSVLVYCQSIIGINYWDIFVYLQNAMLFSHVNIGSQLNVPPILSLITSIAFSLGFVCEASLFVVSGILFIFLVLGIYLLFNKRYSPEVSFVASIIFSMLSLVVTWSVSGSNDLPALCFGVWAVYFTIRGLNDDFKYYYPAVLLFFFAFFTRFTIGFILLVMLFYLLVHFDKFRSQLTRKNIVLMTVFVLFLVVVVGGVYISYQGTIPFISQIFEVSSSSQVSSVNVGYDLNPFYYVENLPQFLTSWSVSDRYFVSLSTDVNQPTILSYVIILLSGIGLAYFIYEMFDLKEKVAENKCVKYVSIIVLSVFLVFTYTHVSYMISEVVFILIVYLNYRWLKGNKDDIDYLMFLWLGIFIILHSYHPVKVDRYILPIFIPIIYFMIKTITKICKNNKKKTLIILSIILLILIPINISYTHSLTKENPHTQLEKETSQWLKNYDPNYTKENISSDRGVAYSWYLKKYTYTTIPRVLNANNESLENKLNQIEAKYYIDSTSNLTNITGYHEIHKKQKDNFQIKIFQRD